MLTHTRNLVSDSSHCESVKHTEHTENTGGEAVSRYTGTQGAVRCLVQGHFSSAQTLPPPTFFLLSGIELATLLFQGQSPNHEAAETQELVGFCPLLSPGAENSKV